MTATSQTRTEAAPTAPTASRLSVAQLDPVARFGIVMTLAAALIYWLSNMHFDATRGDFFYLADAFLHGRVWLDVRLGYQDVIVRDGHVLVPFAPFPAIAQIGRASCRERVYSSV